jgi:thiamine biosynthesis lipoprotein ApbE
VTIVAPHGIAADGVSVLGPDRGIVFVEKYPGAAALIRAKSGATFESTRFRQLAVIQ